MDDGTTPAPPVDALIGHTLVDRYRLTRKIGEGGMGAVYEALHVLIGKPVAVKVLREKYADRPEVARRLVQEARLASSIRHEHIVDITDSGATEDGRTFVVMEHLDGLSLAELLKLEGPLPETRVLDIARQATSALAAAHERGIVHRDVKPENIFIVERDHRDFVKVLDFGISKSVMPGEMTEESLRLTHTGMVMGTPLYMSPEQARGEDELDQRMDIYSLGVILYECLTGEVPFHGANYLGVIAEVVKAEAMPPRALRPELRISEPMERVVMKAMAKARADRYPTMDELAADLARVAAGTAVEAPTPLPPERAPRPRTGLWLAAVGVFAGTALLLAIDRFTRAPSPPTATTTATVTTSAPPPSAPPAPKTIVLHVETEPPGAEIRQGSRVFGVAPRDLILPRSDVPERLTFRLDGYEDGATQVVPSTDDSLRVKLTPRSRNRHVRPITPATHEPQPLPAGETLPNPY
jgi:serine/threonine protein kinase